MRQDNFYNVSERLNHESMTNIKAKRREWFKFREKQFIYVYQEIPSQTFKIHMKTWIFSCLMFPSSITI